MWCVFDNLHIFLMHVIYVLYNLLLLLLLFIYVYFICFSFYNQLRRDGDFCFFYTFDLILILVIFWSFVSINFLFLVDFYFC